MAQVIYRKLTPQENAQLAFDMMAMRSGVNRCMKCHDTIFGHSDLCFKCEWTCFASKNKYGWHDFNRGLAGNKFEARCKFCNVDYFSERRQRKQESPIRGIG